MKALNWLFIICSIALPLLELISHVLFIILSDFKTQYLFWAAIIFTFLQPLAYASLFTINMFSSLQDFKSTKTDDEHIAVYYLRALIFIPIYSLLMMLWLLGAFEKLNKETIHLFKLEFMKMLTVENSFWVQIWFEFILTSVPMAFVISSSESYMKEFGIIGGISLALTCLMVIKNGIMLVWFVSERLFEGRESNMRMSWSDGSEVMK